MRKRVGYQLLLEAEVTASIPEFSSKLDILLLEGYVSRTSSTTVQSERSTWNHTSLGPLNSENLHLQALDPSLNHSAYPHPIL